MAAQTATVGTKYAVTHIYAQPNQFVVDWLLVWCGGVVGYRSGVRRGFTCFVVWWLFLSFGHKVSHKSPMAFVPTTK